MGRVVQSKNNCYRLTFSCSNAVKFLNFIYQNKNIYLERKYQVFQKYLEIRKEELEICQIRPQFEDYEKIINLLKSHTYKEIADMYCITPKTVIDRLRKVGLHKPNRKYS